MTLFFGVWTIDFVLNPIRLGREMLAPGTVIGGQGGEEGGGEEGEGGGGNALIYVTVCIDVYMYLYMCVYVYANMYVCICINICAYVCLHM